MNDATPAQNRTLAASEAGSGLPADQGAREALVEQLAEVAEAVGTYFLGAWAEAAADVRGDGWERDAAREAASQWLEPLVAAQVEAAVSVVRAEQDGVIARMDESVDAAVSQAVDALARAESAEADLRALREGLESLANARDVKYPERFQFAAGDNHVAGYRQAQADLRSFLAPSPAEGTSEGRVLQCPVCGSGEEGDCVCGPRGRCICNDPPVAREVVCRLHPNAHLATPAPVSSGKSCGHHPDLLCGCGVFPERDQSAEAARFLSDFAFREDRRSDRRWKRREEARREWLADPTNTDLYRKWLRS